ncbi:hypothetical protein PVAP13_6KG197918 [Panicum virgatum]|uniref:Uncharacterized protein n=1 Tax=Panicum virgatum TaxID=38727 RepID=A0A8T0REB3_PANVG|nr:hypothetical protein PVAP13_6KG197918 [Panicum virgatum]KAG2583108.1 hypothetical protein PVAP13_6KG197918 [Panicum virgatum]KAG2583109.1 hypothetical protein PVAP13_6KG197918 [Panicum virgatum]
MSYMMTYRVCINKKFISSAALSILIPDLLVDLLPLLISPRGARRRRSLTSPGSEAPGGGAPSPRPGAGLPATALPHHLAGPGLLTAAPPHLARVRGS